jgi:predicted nucleotidyltransferase component of viral defense system
MPDVGASILVKIKNKAKLTGKPYQLCLQLFFQEEFLRRLSRSNYVGNLILKGGLFIYTLTNFESRATVDIDFLLHQMSSNPEHIDKVLAEILATPSGFNDIVILTAKKAASISPQRQYPGVSAQIIGHIKNVRVPFDVDIGVGDVIVPKAQKRAIKPQLTGYDAPEVLTYSLESTVAEKLDAILQRFELTGRMKDFYDIYYLSHTFDFKGRALQEAISQTLTTRGTSYEPGSYDRILSLAEDADMQTKWRLFLRTMQSVDLPLAVVMAGIDVFLHPVWEAMIGKEEFQKTWHANMARWM